MVVDFDMKLMTYIFLTITSNLQTLYNSIFHSINSISLYVWEYGV